MVKQRSKNKGAEPVAQPATGAEAELFRAAVRDVRPLSQVPRPLAASAAQARRRPRRPALALEDLDTAMPLLATTEAGEVSSSSDPVDGNAALSFHRAGVRIQVMRRLRRGLYPTDDELDLHGLSQTAARDRLADFIAGSRDSGHRCVRIIHGKGYRSGARGPVLKTAVNLWLRRHLDVIAFVSAKAIDGGTGALYVLLRA